MKKLDTRKAFKPEKPLHSTKWLAFPGKWSGNNAHFTVIDWFYSDPVTGRPTRTFVDGMYILNLVIRTVNKLRGYV